MSTATTQQYAYIPISVATLRPRAVSDFPLYIRDSSDSQFRLYRDASFPVEVEDLQKLVEHGVHNLYVAINDHHLYQQYLRKNFAGILDDVDLPVSQRFGCLDALVRDLLSEVFAKRDIEEAVESTRRLAIETVALICQEESVASELLGVLHHDYHTFTHSANVSYYCVLLAREYGITEQRELEQIAMGALLHDVGKLDIPQKILKKRGCLNSQEFEFIRRHPAIGFQLLAKREDLGFGQLMMVYQHHERLDGSGYPVGITKSSIHPWAQLCGIVDMFEALTSHRPYRSALTQEEAVSVLDREAGQRLNQEMWECLKKIIQQP